MHEKLKLDDFFCIRHRQSWKKDLERFCANNSKIPPLSPVSSFKFQVSILLDSLVSRQGMYKNTKHIYTIANNKHEKYSC